MLSVTKCQSSKCVLESTTTHACGAADPGAGVLMLNPGCAVACLQAGEHMHASWYCHE